MLGVDVEKKYGDSVNRFYVTLSGKNRPDDKVLITLSREGFFFWRVTNAVSYTHLSGDAAAFAFNEAVTPHAPSFGMTVPTLGTMAALAGALGRCV